ncbi:MULTISPECIES: tetratricopeptide repeat protein [Vibrio]|uniref:Pilus assembly protein TadD n=1 Tax=Vibrio diazotrophicus TaxID=685 RepID=A0A2J8HXD9_VIBDI|nr:MULTISPECIES: tetratricopeptide repeat protein [Vibrio]MCF7364204.1 tetratricopeptide repeat protein [Vibrio sp. A1-b2]PNH79291.1 pilus assembly protein TadD [Vibrio diazotrophicus]PNH90493.1 pilus assembly protein TadD [Vibrio diazotrophicus]PNH95229.1 pilus assembly protein TadD [Vibrio diazotrophicus]PNH97557.1 pilus assembly protein TadD [Vibrio diazotrophicus]
MMNGHVLRMWALIFVSSLLVGCATPGKVKKQTESNNRVLAEAAFNYAQYDKAEAQYLALLELSPENLHYQMMLGRSQYHQDKKQTAIAKLRYVCASDDAIAAESCVYLGRFLLTEGRESEAVAAYQLGVSKAKDTHVKAQLHNGLGVALLANHPKQARSELEHAILLSPDEPYFRSNLAVSYLHNNQVKKAREVFSPLLAYQQLPLQVELNFALLLLAEGNENEARALLSRHLPASEVERDIEILISRLAVIRDEK